MSTRALASWSGLVILAGILPILPTPAFGGDVTPMLSEGAVTPAARAFWSFQPLGTPAIPTVDDPAWSGSEIDRFLLAKHRAAGVAPVGLADRRALIRRVTFDLTGLPPAPEEVDAFLADGSADAYPKLVERLLASRQYGERWARHWLDVVRYADTAGETRTIPRRTRGGTAIM